MNASNNDYLDDSLLLIVMSQMKVRILGKDDIIRSSAENINNYF